MYTYQVTVNKDNRIILDKESHGKFIQLITALNYEKARLKVDTTLMYLDEGYGWFLR